MTCLTFSIQGSLLLVGHADGDLGFWEFRKAGWECVKTIKDVHVHPVVQVRDSSTEFCSCRLSVRAIVRTQRNASYATPRGNDNRVGCRLLSWKGSRSRQRQRILEVVSCITT